MPTDDHLKRLQMGPAADWEPSSDSYRSDLYRFTTRATRKPANAVVEKFKLKLKHQMDKKINKSGDLMYWILLRAFVFWCVPAAGGEALWLLKSRLGVAPDRCEKSL
jgi:hypothetical protein